MIYRKSLRKLQGRKQQRASNPLIGQTFTGTVNDIAASGAAIIEHSSGASVFVRGAWLGEKVRVQIEQFKKRHGTGRLIEVIEPSADRIEPPCKYFLQTPSCGGCVWQHVNYPAQTKLKQHWVQRYFKSITACPVNTIKASDAVWQYRNRAEFKSDGQSLGFIAAQTHKLIDVSECLVLTPALNQTLQQLRGRLPEPNWKPNKAAKTKAEPRSSALTLLAIDDDMEADSLQANYRRPFKQANEAQNVYLQQWLLSALADAKKDALVLELFCGSGNFTRALVAAGFQRIVASEVAELAVSDLNKERLDGVSVVQANLFDDAELARLCCHCADAKTLVLDPPRDGLVCIAPLLQHTGFDTIAYISCDLRSCARDVEQFVAAGYRVASIQPVDMFPQTQHVELCVLLKREG
ncbi:MAG TPA: hypothetical protein VIC26_16555 [Marinagarivorans sp.]